MPWEVSGTKRERKGRVENPPHPSRSTLQGALELGEEARTLGTFVPSLGFLELAQEFLLPGAEPGRGLDLDFDHQIAPAPSLKHRHARTALAQLAGGLDAGRNLDRVGFTIETRDVDRAPERRDRE